MTRNLKALGLAMFAVLALGALTAQGASAAKEQEFRSDGSWTVGTGASVGKIKFAAGTAGTVECDVEFDDQSGGTKVGEEYLSDTLTVTPTFPECTFGGHPATATANHCAFVLDSDTTTGNPEGGEHANVEIECAEGHKIEIDTISCTVTIGAQLVKHAVQFEADTTSSVTGIFSAKGIVTGKAKTTESQTGCLLFASGAIGTMTGTGTTECFKDTGSVLTGTEKTTPQGKTEEGSATECSVK